jgi:hypothetical protein
MLIRVAKSVVGTVGAILAIIFFLLLTPLMWLLNLATFISFVVMVFNFTLTTVACFALSFGVSVGLMWLLTSRK